MPSTFYHVKSQLATSRVVVWDGMTLSTINYGTEPSGRKFSAIGGSSPTDLWAGCNNNGTGLAADMYHYDGALWTEFNITDIATSPYDSWTVRDICMLSASNGFAAVSDDSHTDNGKLAYWNGTSWTLLASFYPSGVYPSLAGGKRGNPWSVDAISLSNVYMAGVGQSYPAVGNKGIWFWNGTTIARDDTVPDGMYGGVAIYDADNVYIYNSTDGTIYKGKFGGPWVAQFTVAAGNWVAGTGSTGCSSHNLAINRSNNNIWLCTVSSDVNYKIHITHFDGSTWSEENIPIGPLGYAQLNEYGLACSWSLLGTNNVFQSTQIHVPKQRPYFNGTLWALTDADPAADWPGCGVWAYDVPDTNPPYVEALDPLASATNVAAATQIKLNVKDDESNIWEASVILTVNGVDAYVSGVAQTGFTVVKTTLANGYYYIITPTTPFVAGALVSIRVRAQDFAGNQVDTTYTFTISNALALNPTTKVYVTRSSDGVKRLAYNQAGAGFIAPYDGALSSATYQASPGSTVNDELILVIDYTGLYTSKETVLVEVEASSGT